MRDGIDDPRDRRLPAVAAARPALAGPFGAHPQRPIRIRRGAFLVGDYAGTAKSTCCLEDSDGEDEVFDDDGWGANQDGYDAVDGLAAQPLADGQVGTFGASASGMTQLLMVCVVPPHLGLLDRGVSVCSIELFHDMTYPGGGFRNKLPRDLAGQPGLGRLVALVLGPPRRGRR